MFLQCKDCNALVFFLAASWSSVIFTLHCKTKQCKTERMFWERVQQRTAEQIEDLPQHPEETVKAVTLVPQERVQQCTADQIEGAPQSLAEVVEAVTLVPREQAQQRTFLSDQEEQLLHSLRNVGRERAMRSLEKLRERHDPPAWLWEGFAELIQRTAFEKYRRINGVHRFFKPLTGNVNGIHPAPKIHEHFMMYKGYGTLRISSRTTSTILSAL